MASSDGTTAILACPTNLARPEEAVAWLDWALPGPDKTSVEFVAVQAKFAPPRPIKTVNLASGYPADLAWLASQRNIVAGAGRLQPFIDAQALFSLRVFVELRREFESVTLLRALDNDQVCCAAADASGPFRCTESMHDTAHRPARHGAIVVDVSHLLSRKALDLAWDIVVSGSHYGMTPYCLCSLLNAAAAIVDSAA
ncbi:hypothetical protein ACFOON_08870 [Novosphingobium piscinae]|uniref:Uncharacterized protein n=1 Tax=Novosphingobium piscinae TaxID=1507448 RepID=A0A7X1KPT9_9SPHN|nr:hypothetical protein [Novosphingobium piscinae]MBC2669071.1 hypothetical protein [Novosphingobium piscinae]